MMQSGQTSVLLCLLLAGVVSVMAATKPLTTTPVIMFDNKDYSGNSQNFPVAMPDNGCSPCTSLVRSSFILVLLLAQHSTFTLSSCCIVSIQVRLGIADLEQPATHRRH